MLRNRGVAGERLVGKETSYHFADGVPNGSIRAAGEQHVVNTCPRAIGAIGQVAVRGYTPRLDTESPGGNDFRSRKHTSREYSSYSRGTTISTMAARRCERIAHLAGTIALN